MANAHVRIVNQAGRRETVTAFEARLMELASGHCRRRLFCQDFIALVLQAARMTPDAFNAAIDHRRWKRLERAFPGRRAEICGK